MYPERDCWLSLIEQASDGCSVNGLPVPPEGITSHGYYHIVPYTRKDGLVNHVLWYRAKGDYGRRMEVTNYKIGTWVTDYTERRPTRQSSITTEGNEVVVNAGQWNEWIGIVRLDTDGRCKGMPYLEPIGEMR